MEIPDAVFVVEDICRTPAYLFKRRLQPVVEAAGLPTTGELKVTAHTLRHTYASHLVMKGM